MDIADLDYTPFDTKGGSGKMWALFGEEMDEQRAIKLRIKHKTDGNVQPNCRPYTNMDELVDIIKKISFND